jgi:hypothetical protein
MVCELMFTTSYLLLLLPPYSSIDYATSWLKLQGRPYRGLSIYTNEWPPFRKEGDAFVYMNARLNGPGVYTGPQSPPFSASIYPNTPPSFLPISSPFI